VQDMSSFPSCSAVKKKSPRKQQAKTDLEIRLGGGGGAGGEHFALLCELAR